MYIIRYINMLRSRIPTNTVIYFNMFKSLISVKL